jgi:hypothetical protein
MPAAGDVINSADVNVRVGVTPITANSATYGATESAALFSVTAPLVSGQNYKIFAYLTVAADVAGDTSFMRLREDTASGTQVAGSNVYCGSNNANGYATVLYTEYTALSTASKTWVITGQRVNGSGTAHGIKAGASRQNSFTVDLIVS